MYHFFKWSLLSLEQCLCAHTCLYWGEGRQAWKLFIWYDLQSTSPCSVSTVTSSGEYFPRLTPSWLRTHRLQLVKVTNINWQTAVCSFMRLTRPGSGGFRCSKSRSPPTLQPLDGTQWWPLRRAKYFPHVSPRGQSSTHSPVQTQTRGGQKAMRHCEF